MNVWEWVIAAWCIVAVFACSIDGEHDVKVRGGTTNRIELAETFCDSDSYPTTAERRACKDALLEAMKCEAGK